MDTLTPLPKAGALGRTVCAARRDTKTPAVGCRNWKIGPPSIHREASGCRSGIRRDCRLVKPPYSRMTAYNINTGR